MPTPAERKALLFVAGILMLGAGIRAVRAVRNAPSDDPASRTALRNHIAAVDSARVAQRGRKKSVNKSKRKRQPAAITGSECRVEGLPAAPHPEPCARLVDLDIASALEIELLPRIGAVLAKRIVADRDSFGPFGSLEGFVRVRGVGPAMARTVSPMVTFSLNPRHSRVDDRGSGSGMRNKDARRRRGLRRRSP